jgi:hypothetical protein
MPSACHYRPYGQDEHAPAPIAARSAPRSRDTRSNPNFDSQWITTQAKDGLNSVGVGAWFNVLDYGQMLLFHVILLPLVLGVLVVWHVLLVRHRGVVPPFAITRTPATPPAGGAQDTTQTASTSPAEGSHETSEHGTAHGRRSTPLRGQAGTAGTTS